MRVREFSVEERKEKVRYRCSGIIFGRREGAGKGISAECFEC